MQSFKALSRELLADASFRELFERECHICTNTLQIIAQMHRENREAADVARALGVDPAAVENLATADYCDPRLVIRLCKHFDLPKPENCPRLHAHQTD